MLLRPGQDTVISWDAGALECRVVAAAGQFVLLAPERGTDATGDPSGHCSLTYLEGMVPMGWDGTVERAGHPGELRFRVRDGGQAADRRSSVRVPVTASATLRHGDETLDGQVLDVSAGGLRLRHRGRLASGTPVHVRVELPGSLVVDADGVVRTSQPGVSCVEFTAMHAADPAAVGAWTVGVLRANFAPRA